jgi:hypothetical protein
VITSLLIENFKCFKRFHLHLDRLSLLVGGNNSGKTTVFHALQLIFWCVNQIVNEDANNVTLGKTQVTEIPVLPYDHLRDIFHNQQVRAGRQPAHLRLTLETVGLPPVVIEVYQAYSRNFMVTGNELSLTKEQFARLQDLTPIFVPGTIGITTKEDFYRPIALESLIRAGRQNQVLRNLLFQLRESQKDWDDFVAILKPLFRLHGIDVPFDVDSDLWLKAIYDEGSSQLDLVSAGAGFLQIVNLLTFLFRYKTRVALLDEPDSHMHEDLLRLAFDLLDNLSESRNLQLIIATHSPVLIDAAGLGSVLLIDKTFEKPLHAQDVESLVPLLSDRGLSLPPSKVMDTLRSRRVLFVEGEEKDYEHFLMAFGSVLRAGFRSLIRGLTVFEIGEGRKDWPFDAIEAFQRLIGVQLQYHYLSDRDFLLPSEVDEREARATSEGQKIQHLERRNRECYLLEPSILARVLCKKWIGKDTSFPSQLEEAGVHEWLLDYAKQAEEKVRTAILVEHESYLRGPAEHRTRKTAQVLEYFRENYTTVVARGELPWRLLDGKQCLKAFRRHVADAWRIHFQDSDVIGCFTPEEVPQDICALVHSVLQMFPEEIPRKDDPQLRLFSE